MAGLTVEQKAEREQAAEQAMREQIRAELRMEMQGQINEIKAELVAEMRASEQARPPVDRIEEVKNDAALRQEIMNGEYVEAIISGGDAGRKSITLSVQGQVNRYECGKPIIMPFPFFDAMKNMTYMQGKWDETGHKTEEYTQRVNFQIVRQSIPPAEARTLIKQRNDAVTP